ncbi:MAG: Obg family GTPase CgtA, partial [Clostridia bacterium]|nr:Obg family GTPase CgtA [Clostridia bacterium]
VDVSGYEGRAAADDFNTISEELENFSEELASRPRIIAANKCDLLPDGIDTEEMKSLRILADALGYKVIPISTATRMGIKELINEIERQLETLPPITVFEAEVFEEELQEDAIPENTTIRRADDGAYVCEGAWLEKLCGRVYFDDRESLMYFQRSLTNYGIIEKLRQAGCGEGDTVRMFDIEFDFID